MWINSQNLQQFVRHVDGKPHFKYPESRGFKVGAIITM